MSLLAVEDLAVRFGGVRAVNGLSFAVAKGQVFAIVGPNGAGKTTVFNLVTRVFDSDAGRIALDGADITRVPRHRVVAHGIARTFQNIELFENATVLENLLIARHPHNRVGFFDQLFFTPRAARREIADREKVEDVIDLLELARWRASPVGMLPYGARKVVELARALCAEPKLLLLDEPASGLNPEEVQDLAYWIQDIRDELGITVVMVEHNMNLVAQVSDRVLVMNHGEKLAEGTAAEVQSDARVIQAYLGG